jgi:uncharacterized repeat protein (TIGR01451 family)
MRLASALGALWFCLAGGAHAAAQRVEVLSLVDPSLRPVASPNSGSFTGFNRHDLHSADARFVLIETQATNLDRTVDDINGDSDVYLLDTATQALVLVSHRAGAAGVAANAASRAVALSRDGNRALFASAATDLLAGQVEGNAGFDLFLFDRASGQTQLVSRRLPGATATPDGESSDGFLDATGQRVVFRTAATNLIPGVVDTNAADDTYLFDLSGPSPVLRLLSSNAGAPSQAGSARSIPLDISRDGQRIAMLSGANAMVAGQTGTGDQLYLLDRFGTRRMVTHAAGNATQGGNLASGDAHFSGDGRWLVLGSRASDLVAGVTDTNSLFDIFLHDCVADATTLVTSSAASATTTGNQGGNATAFVNDDGTRIAFASNASNLLAGVTDNNAGASDIFVQETATRARTLVSFREGTTATASGASNLLGFDDAGRHVLFESSAPDLLAGQVDGASSRHLFLFALDGVDNTLVSRRHDAPLTATATGISNGRLTAAGDAVLFSGPDELDASDDNANTDPFVFRNGANTRLLRPDPTVDNTMSDGGSTVMPGAIDDFGRRVAFTSTSQRVMPGLSGPSAQQLFVRDRADGSVRLATHTPAGSGVRSGGALGAHALSGDGEFLAFISSATDLAGATVSGGNAQLYLWNRATGEVILASHAAGTPGVAGNGAVVGQPRITPDGRFVAYLSGAGNLVAGQSGATSDNLFLYDRVANANTLASYAAGTPAQGAGSVGAQFDLSDDGALLGFSTLSPSVAQGVADTNGTSDVFLYVRASGANLPVSRSRSSARMALGGSSDADLSADGSHVVFRSLSNELLPGAPTSGTTSDVYLWQRSDDSVRLVSHNAGNAAQPANAGSLAAQLSDDGSRIVFHSVATDLVPGFTSPHGLNSLFLFEAASGNVALLGHAAGNDAQSANAEVLFTTLAGGGTHAAFLSRASNLVSNQVDAGGAADVFLVDLATREVFLASHRLGEPRVAALPNTGAFAVAPAISRNGLVAGFGTRGDDLARHDVGLFDAFAYVHDEPTRAAIAGVEPSSVRVGEPYVVTVDIEASRGPATGRVVVDDGAASCSFDLAVADAGHGSCTLASASPGARTLQASFTPGAGFAPSRATRALTVLPPAQSDVSLALLAPAGVAPGDAFEVTVMLANAGPDRNGPVAVDFSGLPDVISSAGSGWTCAPATPLRCVLDVLAVGTGAPLTLRLQAPPADATLSLQATASSALADPDASDNQAGATVQVDAAPRITQVAPATGSTEGGYPLQVSGSNFGAASGSVDLGTLPCAVTVWTPTQIVCTVPPGAGVRDVRVVQATTVLDRATFSAFAYAPPALAAIAPAVGSADGNYDLTLDGGNFGAQGASVSIGGADCGNVRHDAAQPHRRLRCPVPPGTGGNLAVVVTQSGQSSDGGARFAYAAILSDLLIAKDSTRTEVFARNVDEWTLLVSNLGPDPATGARVLDALPAHLGSVSWTCTGFAGAACRSAAGLGNIDVLLDLPVGGSALFQVSARIPRAPLVDVVNIASVGAPAGQGDPVPANNTDTEVDPMGTVFFDDFELD